MADYKILTIPFARDAVPDMVNDIPNDPSIADPQLASFKQGFPSITTIPLVAGGIPPEGQDFNGILRDITEHIVHQNKGGMYKFEPEVVAAGGYPKGAVLESNDGSGLFVSLVDSNIEDFNSGSAQWQRLASEGSVVSISVNSSISPAQLGLLLLDASGGNRTFTLPASSSALGIREVVLRRADVTGNALVIAANGTDKIMLDTTAEAAGEAMTELLFAGDFLRLRSDGAGKWWCVGQAQLPGSIASGLVAFTAPGSHTFTVPPVLRSGRRVPTITVVGGGGGGGEGPRGWRGAGGGGGGAGILRRSLAGVLSVAVTVGGGGAGGVGLSVGGQTGGSSSFGAYVSAIGGGGGGNNPGGTPGGAPGADVTLIGAHGSDGSDGGGGGGSGDGGASAFGGGGRSGSSYGLPGSRHGGGGGGGTGTAGGGGDGAGGLVLIQW